MGFHGISILFSIVNPGDMMKFMGLLLGFYHQQMGISQDFFWDYSWLSKLQGLAPERLTVGKCEKKTPPPKMVDFMGS